MEPGDQARRFLQCRSRPEIPRLRDLCRRHGPDHLDPQGHGRGARVQGQQLGLRFLGVASLALGLGCTLPFPADQRLTCINNDKPHYKETGETHKFSLAWQVTPDKMVYATYSTGFRPGGVNSLAEMQAYEADRLTNYEIGFKTNWNNILRWNAAIYYEKWTGIQYTIIPLGYFGNGGTVNAGAARVYGIETDFSLKLGKFTISGSGAYNNAALTQDFCALDPATLVPLSNCSDNPDAVAAAKGTRLPRQPRFKGQLTARYDGDWGSVKDFAQLTMHAQTMSTSNLDTYKNSLLGNTPGFVSFDMSAGISRDNWTLTAFIENMFDRRGQLSKNTFCAIEYCSGSSRTMPIKPQYFGLKYSVRY
jgi:outer membrane receptor protein involved in Fe transport